MVLGAWCLVLWCPVGGTPEGIAGRVRHRRSSDEPPHPGAHPRRAGSRHRRDEKPAGSASRADCFLRNPVLLRQVLSLGEAVSHVERLLRTRDLLAVKGYDTDATKLACYSGAGFDVLYS